LDEEDDLRSWPIDCPYCQERIPSSDERCRWCGRKVDCASVEDELVRLRKERTLYNLLSIAFGLPGLALSAMTSPVMDATKQGGAGNATLLWPIVLLGPVLLLVGVIFYAKYKGQHAAYGLFILLGCIGLIVLAVLNDKKAKQIRRLKRFLDDY
jgi:hypothetical protein